MSATPTQAADRVAERLREIGDPEDAAKMAAYMKTDMPFFGVKSKPRDRVMREETAGVEVADQGDYEALVLEFWTRPQREQKYIAIRLARRFDQFVHPESLQLYERLIREGAWWDLVDETAAHLVHGALEAAPEEVFPVLDEWIRDDDMWIRRSAMIVQLHSGEHTDVERLFDYALQLGSEDEFFIRKAIGWALRSYAATNPERVLDFLEEHREDFSNLTLREASKHLDAFDI